MNGTEVIRMRNKNSPIANCRSAKIPTSERFSTSTIDAVPKPTGKGAAEAISGS
jgi:hypothetical protein